MTLAFYDALDEDAEALTALHATAAANLTARFGQGPWSHALTMRRIERVPGRTWVRVGRFRDRVVAAQMQLHRAGPGDVPEGATRLLRAAGSVEDSCKG